MKEKTKSETNILGFVTRNFTCTQTFPCFLLSHKISVSISQVLLNYCIQYNLNANYIQYSFKYFPQIGNWLPKDLSCGSLQLLPLRLRMTGFDILLL